MSLKQKAVLLAALSSSIVIYGCGPAGPPPPPHHVLLTKDPPIQKTENCRMKTILKNEYWSLFGVILALSIGVLTITLTEGLGECSPRARGVGHDGLDLRSREFIRAGLIHS